MDHIRSILLSPTLCIVLFRDETHSSVTPRVSSRRRRSLRRFRPAFFTGVTVVHLFVNSKFSISKKEPFVTFVLIDDRTVTFAYNLGIRRFAVMTYRGKRLTLRDEGSKPTRHCSDDLPDVSDVSLHCTNPENHGVLLRTQPDNSTSQQLTENHSLSGENTKI